VKHSSFPKSQSKTVVFRITGFFEGVNNCCLSPGVALTSTGHKDESIPELEYSGVSLFFCVSLYIHVVSVVVLGLLWFLFRAKLHCRPSNSDFGYIEVGKCTAGSTVIPCVGSAFVGPGIDSPIQGISVLRLIQRTRQLK
jgi:hypothetical protein